jgi:hypothetical protein
MRSTIGRGVGLVGIAETEIDEVGATRPHAGRHGVGHDEAVRGERFGAGKGPDSSFSGGRFRLSRNPEEKSGPCPNAAGRAAGPGARRRLCRGTGMSPARDPGRGRERRRGPRSARAAPEHGEPAERSRAHPAPARAEREELSGRAARSGEKYVFLCATARRAQRSALRPSSPSSAVATRRTSTST